VSVVEVVPMVVLLFVRLAVEVLAFVMQVLGMLVFVGLTVVRMGVPCRMPLVQLGFLAMNGLAGVIVELLKRIPVVVRHDDGDMAVHLGWRRFVDKGPGVRLRGDDGLACVDRLGGRLYCRLGRHSRLALGRHWSNVLRRGSVEVGLLRRDRHVLAGLVRLFRNSIGVFGVLLQCAELFSGQRPGAIMIRGA
jgi:hypothetical protein